MAQKERGELIKNLEEIEDSFKLYVKILKKISVYYPVNGDYNISLTVDGKKIQINRDTLNQIEQSLYQMVDNLYLKYHEKSGKRKKEGTETVEKYTGFSLPYLVQDKQNSTLIKDITNYFKNDIDFNYENGILTSRNNLASLISIWVKKTKQGSIQASAIRTEIKDKVIFEKVALNDKTKKLLQDQKLFIDQEKSNLKTELTSPRKSPKPADQIIIRGVILEFLRDLLMNMGELKENELKYKTSRALLSRIILIYLLQENEGRTIKEANQFLRQYKNESPENKSEIEFSKIEYEPYEEKKKKFDSKIKDLKKLSKKSK